MKRWSLRGVCGAAQRGFSLVEFGVALVALALLLGGAVHYWRTAVQARQKMAEADVLVQARQALTAFAHGNHRLPCPDTDDDGREDCFLAGGGVTRVGRLPWVSLQLQVDAARRLGYGVERQPHIHSWQDRDLAVVNDRMRPLVSLGPTPTATDTLLGNRNLLDFCDALHRGVDVAVTITNLATFDRDPATPVWRSAAYVLVSPGAGDADGDGSPLDELNGGATHDSPKFEAGHRAQGASYDDRVLAVRPETLFADLQCAPALSATSHAHPNAALAAAITRRGLSDLRYQLQVKAVLAGAGVANAIAGQLMAAAGLANAIASLANAGTFTVITVGSTGGLIAAATAAVVANTAATVTATATLAASIAITVEAALREARGAELATTADTLATSVEAEMRRTDYEGL